MGTDTKMSFVCKRYKGADNDMKRSHTFYDVMDCIRNTLKASYMNFKEVDCSRIYGRAMWLNFKDGEDQRQIYMCLDCEADQLDKFSIQTDEQIIHFSLGYWGNSVKIMETLGKALCKEIKGSIYIDRNDCDEKECDIFITSGREARNEDAEKELYKAINERG